MESLLSQARHASRDPKDCRKTIERLRRMGFGDEAFKLLHHHRDTMAGFLSFGDGVRRFRDDKNNHRVHQRLMYVLLACPGGSSPKNTSFEILAGEAFHLIPPI